MSKTNVTYTLIGSVWLCSIPPHLQEPHLCTNTAAHRKPWSMWVTPPYDTSLLYQEPEVTGYVLEVRPVEVLARTKWGVKRQAMKVHRGEA